MKQQLHWRFVSVGLSDCRAPSDLQPSAGYVRRNIAWMCNLALDEGTRHHSCHLATRGQNRISKVSHESHSSTAVDETETGANESFPSGSRCLLVSAVSA